MPACAGERPGRGAHTTNIEGPGQRVAITERRVRILGGEAKERDQALRVFDQTSTRQSGHAPGTSGLKFKFKFSYGTQPDTECDLETEVYCCLRKMEFPRQWTPIPKTQSGTIFFGSAQARKRRTTGDSFHRYRDTAEDPHRLSFYNSPAAS